MIASNSSSRLVRFRASSSSATRPGSCDLRGAGPFSCAAQCGLDRVAQPTPAAKAANLLRTRGPREAFPPRSRFEISAIASGDRLCSLVGIPRRQRPPRIAGDGIRSSWENFRLQRKYVRVSNWRNASRRSSLDLIENPPITSCRDAIHFVPQLVDQLALSPFDAAPGTVL